jgi:hypothetical protein
MISLRRREGFPSWSWAGWTGTVARFSELDQADSATHVEIFVKCRDKLRGGWSRFEDMMTSMQAIVRHTNVGHQFTGHPTLSATFWVWPSRTFATTATPSRGYMIYDFAYRFLMHLVLLLHCKSAPD